MPYETHWENDGVRWVYTGVMSDDDVLRSNQELYEDSRFETIKYEIADLTHIARFAATAETVRKLTHMDAEQSARNANIKVAILATEALVLGIANMYALAATESPWETRVFSSEEEAREWLAPDSESSR